MRALLCDPDAAGALRLDEAAEPRPGPGEVASLPDRCRPGEVAGWDAVGVVVRPAADDSGPPVGTRVVTFGWMGGWAQRRAVPTAGLAVVPDRVDLGAASALPVAGVTALRAVRAPGPVEGRRVLVADALTHPEDGGVVQWFGKPRASRSSSAWHIAVDVAGGWRHSSCARR
jgi:NADPH:quinone reductase